MNRILFGAIAFLFVMIFIFLFASSGDNTEWVYMKDNGQCYFVKTIPNKQDTTIIPKMVYQITTVDCETLPPDILLYKFAKE